MKFWKSTGKFLLYPIVRPWRDAWSAGEKLSRDVAELRRLREKRRTQAAQFALQPREGLEVDLSRYTPEQQQNPRLIQDDAERFDVVARVKEWTAPELAQQLAVIRRGKRILLGILMVGVLTGFYSLVMLPFWAALLLAPCFVFGFGLLLAKVLHLGLHQSQLELRRLHSLKVYLGRPDFFAHLIG